MMMKQKTHTKVTAEIDAVDYIKLDRICKRFGITVEDAARTIYTKGVAFFYANVVGATLK